MKRTFFAAVALIGAGCASHPAPTDQVASSLAAVRGAEEAGALQVPEAALHVKLAEEQIEQAKQLMVDDEDNQRAEDLAIRAYQDAELAIAIAREDASKKKLDQFAQVNGGSAGGENPGPQPAGAPSGAATGTGTP
jgi:pyridoxal biosynthesis lyase PdxS